MTDIDEVRARLQRYQDFLARDPQNSNLLAEVADLHLKLGEFEKAHDAMAKALTVSPGNPTLRARQAVIAMAAGRAGEAVEILRGLLAEGIDATALRYNLAYALMYTGDFAQARVQLEAVRSLPDAPPDTLVLLARALHHLGDLDEARHCLNEYLTKHPGEAKALGALALATLDAEDLSGAKRYAEQALEADSANLEGLVTLGSVALERQDGKQARTYFEQAVTRHPKSGRAWAGLGLTAMLDAQLDKATADLERAVAYMPNHIGTWHALAWARLVGNDLKGAAEALNRALAIDRNFGETHGGLAVVAALEGRAEESERLAKVALRLDPQSFSARFAQSLLLAGRGDSETAQKVIGEILNTPIGEGRETLSVQLGRLFRARKR